MGISPITNLIPLPVANSTQGDLDPLPMERVQSSARTGDETYSPSGGKSARGSEDDAEEGEVLQEEMMALEDEAVEENGANSATVPRKISFFA